MSFDEEVKGKEGGCVFCCPVEVSEKQREERGDEECVLCRHI